MAQTVIGFFDNSSEAQSAIQELLNNGFSRDHIDISNVSATDTSSTASSDTVDNVGDSISNFFSSLFDSSDEANRYSEVARHSDSIVTVHAQSNEEAQRAAAILDRFGTVDVDQRYSQYATSANTQTTNADRENMSVPVIEEQLQVGKQVVETGGARLRSRIIERPVEETLRLRNERVRVERTPVNRPANAADFNTFQEGTIEISERAEVPVVAKEARVVEEVSIGKDVEERTETVSDTVRRTDVEVEEIETDETQRGRAANS